MADITQTAANVGLASSTATLQAVQVGEAVTQGQPGYPSGTKYYQTDANDSAKAAATGVFLTAAATDGYAVFQSAGDVDLGATLTVGDTLYVSVTKGGIADAPPVSGGYVTTLGIVETAGKLPLDINSSGIAVP